MKGICSLVTAAHLLFAGTSAAADKELTEAQIKKMESATKLLLIDLFAAEVWNKKPAVGEDPALEAVEDLDEKTVLTAFKKYDPKAKIKIPKYDENREDFSDKAFLIVTGAEYRHALICYVAFGHYKKLDEDAKKRINTEIFGQESRPTGAKFNEGVDRWKQFGLIVAGEILSRPSK